MQKPKNRTRLTCRKQYKDEPAEKYAENLRKIYDSCIYRSFSECRLCNQFINGILDDDLRNHLYETPNLSFDETVAKAIEFENATKITHYQSQALSMINIYNPEKEGIFYAWLNQFEQETVEKYADSLKRLYDKYYSMSYRDKKLRVRFINGVRDSGLRKYLKNIHSLSFNDMVTQAIEFINEKENREKNKIAYMI
ncbi:hypothetical protein M0804_013726 [Polistes exclamans]|nr:hypothetical protein M0804_013726 [Polistes exclamans]